ncbi:YcaO-like family protein [Streptomyces sp. NBC_00287]|uniref:YcaO-like family protein n=1 Tax=Streptomyces sp. NBC_00287 TaxID=2975702 RepID=UPI002E2E10AB|nr:YcaO-like family protein [Streptomyces sp. NBC_00287]
MRKVYFDGTHRTRPPEETWETIRPLLPSYGITRVADVTGLDDLGIPVTMAVRPLARTLSVAQGKGTTLVAARVSGAMEAIEAWHGERAVPKPEFRAPADHLGLPYPVTVLEAHPGSLVTSRTVLEWVTSQSLTDGALVPVPAACVRLGRQMHDAWRLHLPSSSTNGLASGNTRAEGLCHALYEVIERDVISDLADGHRPVAAQRIDPASVEDAGCAALLDRLTRARIWFELWSLPNRFGVPVMVCYLWREDQPTLVVSGSGSHLDPRIALSRAVTEAAQTRLTQITGSREDIHPLAFQPGTHSAPAHDGRPTAPWPQVAGAYGTGHATDEEEAAYLAAVVAARTGVPPLAVDLSWGQFHRRGLSVVKVLAPHLRYVSRHTIPRPASTEAAA